MSTQQTQQEVPLTLKSVTAEAQSTFRSQLERGADQSQIEAMIEELSDQAVPGSNDLLLQIVSSDLGLLYFDTESGQRNAHDILAEAIKFHVQAALHGERHAWEREQEENENAEAEWERQSGWLGEDEDEE